MTAENETTTAVKDTAVRISKRLAAELLQKQQQKYPNGTNILKVR